MAQIKPLEQPRVKKDNREELDFKFDEELPSSQDPTKAHSGRLLRSTRSTSNNISNTWSLQCSVRSLFSVMVFSTFVVTANLFPGMRNTPTLNWTMTISIRFSSLHQRLHPIVNSRNQSKIRHALVNRHPEHEWRQNWPKSSTMDWSGTKKHYGKIDQQRFVTSPLIDSSQTITIPIHFF